MQLHDTERTAIARALTLAALLLATLACSGADESPLAEQDGESLFRTYCSSCHGRDGLGNLGLGGTYEGVRDYWTEENLLKYIADPKAYAAKDPRLGKREMAAISDDVPQAARVKIVRHVLELMDAAP